jgi:hypothetical protein
MPFSTNRINAYADLGDVWLCDQTARVRQKELQFGRHFRLDLSAVLDRTAQIARAARSIETAILRERASNDPIRRATIEAIEHCARLDALTVHAIAL